MAQSWDSDSGCPRKVRARLDRLRDLIERLDKLVAIKDEIQALVEDIRELPERYEAFANRYEQLTNQLDSLQANFERLSQADTEALFESVDLEREMEVLEDQIRSLLLEKLGTEELTEEELERFLVELPEGFRALRDTLALYNTATPVADHQDILFSSAFRTGSLLYPIVTVAAGQAAASLGSISIPTGIGGRKPDRGKAGRGGKDDTKRAKEEKEADAATAKGVSQADLKRFVAAAAAFLEAAFAKEGAAYTGKDGTRYWSDTWFRVYAHMTLAEINKKAKTDEVDVGEGKNKRKRKLAEVARFKLKDWEIGRDDASVDVKLNPADDAHVPKKDNTLSKAAAPKKGMAVPEGKYAALQEAAIEKEFNNSRSIRRCAEIADADDDGVCRDGDTLFFTEGTEIWPTGSYSDPIPMSWPKRSIHQMNRIKLWPNGVGSKDEKEIFNPWEQKPISTSPEATQEKKERLERDLRALTDEIIATQYSLTEQSKMKEQGTTQESLSTKQSTLKEELKGISEPLGKAQRAYEARKGKKLKQPPTEAELEADPILKKTWEAYNAVKSQKTQKTAELMTTIQQLAHFQNKKNKITPERLEALEEAERHLKVQLQELNDAKEDKLTVGIAAANRPLTGKKVRRVKAHTREDRRPIMTIFQRQLVSAGLEVESERAAFKEATSSSADRNYQVDHVLDLAMGGRDKDDNLWPIASGQNASIADVSVWYMGRKVENLATEESLVGKWFIIEGFAEKPWIKR